MARGIGQAAHVQAGDEVTVTITVIGADHAPGRISLFGEDGEELRLWPETTVRIGERHDGTVQHP